MARWHRILVLCVLAVVAVGCAGRKFTRVNYDRVYVGMPADHITRRLGKPTSRRNGTYVYVHETPYYKAVIHVEDGRVAAKEWIWQRPPEAYE